MRTRGKVGSPASTYNDKCMIFVRVWIGKRQEMISKISESRSLGHHMLSRAGFQPLRHLSLQGLSSLSPQSASILALITKTSPGYLQTTTSSSNCPRRPSHRSDRTCHPFQTFRRTLFSTISSFLPVESVNKTLSGAFYLTFVVNTISWSL